MTRNRSFKDLKVLSRESLKLSELPTFLNQTRKLKDRAAVLVVCSQLETGLERAILRKLPGLDDDGYESLFGGDRSLSTFSAQTWLGHALKLFGIHTRNDLEEIRHIRNAFAHSPRLIDFKTPAIARHCGKITLPTRAPHVVPDFRV